MLQKISWKTCEMTLMAFLWIEFRKTSPLFLLQFSLGENTDCVDGKWKLRVHNCNLWRIGKLVFILLALLQLLKCACEALRPNGHLKKIDDNCSWESVSQTLICTLLKSFWLRKKKSWHAFSHATYKNLYLQLFLCLGKACYSLLFFCENDKKLTWSTYIIVMFGGHILKRKSTIMEGASKPFTTVTMISVLTWEDVHLAHENMTAYQFSVFPSVCLLTHSDNKRNRKLLCV